MRLSILQVITATGFQMSWGVGDSIKGWHKAEKQEESMDNFLIEDLLSADQNNFAILYDNIGKVELKKFGKGALIDIIANGKSIIGMYVEYRA
jgi:hypothetical protein